MEKKSIGFEVSDYVSKTIWGYLGGISSGVTKLAVGHPFDTVKVRLQTEGYNGRFNSPIQCLISTVKKEGIFAVYKGATPPLFGWALIDSCQVGTYNMLKIQIANISGKRVDQLGYKDIAVAGWGGGVVSTIVATPVEQIKAKLQVQYDATTKLYSGPIDCAKKLIQSRGITALWSGWESTILFRSFFAVFWPTYFLTTKSLKETSVSSSWHPFIAGGMAATAFWVCSFPFDVVKNRIMAQPETKPLKYPSVRACFKYIYRTEGLKGFYRGFTPCLLRSFPTNGAALMVYEGFMSLHK